MIKNVRHIFRSQISSFLIYDIVCLHDYSWVLTEWWNQYKNGNDSRKHDNYMINKYSVFEGLLHVDLAINTFVGWEDQIISVPTIGVQLFSHGRILPMVVSAGHIDQTCVLPYRWTDPRTHAHVLYLK